MSVVSALLLATLLPLYEQRPFPSLFDAGEYCYSAAGRDDELFKYRLFVPTATAVRPKSPLIIWLHGHGEGGSDNVAHLRWLDRLVMPPPWTRERFPFFVLAVQCPHNNGNWTADNPGQVDMVDVTAAIVDKLLQAYPIDLDRIYLSGVSSGGTGCWEFAVRHPEHLAAIAPFASAGTSHPGLKQLVGIPIWTFHSSEDRKPPVSCVQETVDALKNLGGTVELTVVATGDHDCWTAAFARFHVLDWMFSQRLGHSSWKTSPVTAHLTATMRESFSRWQWWQIVVQIGVPAAILTAIWKVIRHRRRAASSPPPVPLSEN